jgi:hypothetical protein
LEREIQQCLLQVLSFQTIEQEDETLAGCCKSGCLELKWQHGMQYISKLPSVILYMVYHACLGSLEMAFATVC